MSWFRRKGEPIKLDELLRSSEPAPEVEEKYAATIVTDTETYTVNGLPSSRTCRWAEHWGYYGAMLQRDGKPSLFIPARRIMEIKFEVDSDD
jgi:hypothetical protein